MSNLAELRENVFSGLAESAGATFTPDEVDMAINREYQHLQTLVNMKNDEYFAKITVTSTTTNETYAFPADAIKMLMIEINLNGTWYEVTNIPLHKKEMYTRFPSYLLSGGGVKYYIVGNTYGLVPVRSSAGVNDLRLTYVYTPPALVDDDDVPLFPSIYHELLEIGAINRLRRSVQEPPINEADYAVKNDSMMNTIAPRVKHRPKQVRMVPGLY